MEELWSLKAGRLERVWKGDGGYEGGELEWVGRVEWVREVQEDVEEWGACEEELKQTKEVLPGVWRREELISKIGQLRNSKQNPGLRPIIL